MRTKIFKRGGNLFQFILEHIPALSEKSVVVITSKIVALSENRVIDNTNRKIKVKLIKQESDFAIKTKYAWLTVKDNMVMASAGIDESNANGKLILLPKDSFAAARYIRKELMAFFGLKHIGVLITDSRIFPLRAGVVGVALGYAGFRGIKKYQSRPDIFGRKFKFSQTDIADSLAAAAVLTMGEGAERQPLAVITGAPIAFTNHQNKHELEISIAEDMYRPLFEQAANFKKKLKSSSILPRIRGKV